MRTRIMAMPEMVLGALLAAGAITIYAVNIYRHLEVDLFATILLFRACRFCRPWHWWGWSASAAGDCEK